jgi:hypothetical protein
VSALRDKGVVRCAAGGRDDHARGRLAHPDR